MTGDLFVEVEACQLNRFGEEICGDSFRTRKIPEENRVISVLSDGLGHGVKASILSTMTATMALRFTASDTDIVSLAETVMEALPICRVRKISYATFTIADIRLDGAARIIEMDNPPFLLVRDGTAVPAAFEEIASPRWKDRTMRIYNLNVLPEDRLIFISDGITQAGMGSDGLRLGWRLDGCRSFVLEQVRRDPLVSARSLAGMLLNEALGKEPARRAGDDMTAAVIYFRQPRRTLVLSGPPYDMNRDREFARTLDSFNGRRVICGGTTANIIARELDREITEDLTTIDGEVPPCAGMAGVDLVTEGILTLSKAARLLEGENRPGRVNAATLLAELLRESDSIFFLVGTRINEAHQDPNHPADLEIRRNIIKRIARVLEEKYLKNVRIRYL